MTTVADRTVEFADMQALLRFSHGHLAESSFLLLTISDADAARQWLRQAPVSAAVLAEKVPQQALQLAFTAAGLRALGVDDSVIGGFSEEFVAGMAGEGNRSRRLGDLGANSPQRWQWGGAAGEPHLILMLYARPGELAAWREQVQGGEFAQAFALQYELPALATSNREPFGFVDGISQPEIDWWGEVKTGPHERDKYSNFLALGELALGYRNEYGLLTDRPLLDPARFPAARQLPEAAEDPALHDLGCNGSYLVVRQLAQDVAGFWRYLDRAADSRPFERERLAAAMVGRERDGTPLVPAEGDNRFTFDDDPLGRQCPLGAHVRRSNPRTGDFPPGVTGLLSRMLRILGFKRRHPHDDLVASTRFHRILRRGRVYGPELPPEAALVDENPAQERGLHFVCLGANISRQFEFVQSAWSISSKFAGLEAEADPLLGNREPLPGGAASDRFSMPREDKPAQCLPGLPQFVEVRGGAYFFIPGLRALRFIAGDD